MPFGWAGPASWVDVAALQKSMDAFARGAKAARLEERLLDAILQVLLALVPFWRMRGA